MAGWGESSEMMAFVSAHVSRRASGAPWLLVCMAKGCVPEATHPCGPITRVVSDMPSQEHLAQSKDSARIWHVLVGGGALR